MTGIAAPAWLIWAIALGSFGALLTWMLVTFHNLKPPVFLPLPGTSIPLSYVGTVEAARLARAVGLAVDAIERLGPWPSVRLRGALAGTRIEVRPTLVWSDGVQMVGGQDFGDLAVVGSDLSALAHELIHVAETMIDGRPDYEQLPGSGKHPTWGPRGLDAADQTYREAMAAS